MIAGFNRIYRSFSFRLTFLSLLVFLVALFVMRYSIYYGVVNEAEKDVKTIISANMDEITRSFDKNGNDYGMNVISSMLGNDREKMFVVLYANRKGKVLEGNLAYWPEITVTDTPWGAFEVVPGSGTEDEDDDMGDTRQFIATVKELPKGGKLLVGYDTKHLENIKRIMLTIVWQNIIFSLLAAIVCSVVITLIISKRLKILNKTCEEVMGGRLDHRVPLSGSNDEFDRLGVNFNSMLGWINQLISNIKETTDNLAHDMRTPLNRHRIRLESIITDPATLPATGDKMQEAVREVDRVVEMFDSILSISRAEAKSGITSFTNFDLRELADDLVDLYGFLAEQKKITITTRIPDKIDFKGDRQLFAQALMNLIDNAVKYTPQNGKVEFNIDETPGEIKFTVADSGEGIPEEFHDKVKERFYRLDKSRTTPGSGLGLSLVDAVVKLHQGRMYFSSGNPGFIVTLVFEK